MKNAIFYYYQLSSYDIHKIDKAYFFKSSSYDLALIPTMLDNKEIEDLNNLSIRLMNLGIETNQIIYNKANLPITNIDGINYVLIKYNKGKDQIITINDIMYFSNITTRIDLKEKIKWKKLWIDKIEYMEYQITHFGKSNPKIRESFSYYVGLGENAISLINSLGENYAMSVQHTRLKHDCNFFEFYNPLNFVVDSRVRDVCEYIKSKFFSIKNLDMDSLIESVEDYIVNQKYSRDELILFLSRLLFPTYYFDLYEQIVVGLKDEMSINLIIDRVNNYEKFLKRIYLYMCTFVSMPDIEWLKKNN